MYSGGFFQSMPGMREAVTGPAPTREWLDEAADRLRRRMHSADTESLQSQVDQLRLYVAVLFRLLVSRGAFTVEDAELLICELEAAGGELDGSTARDVVSGAALPPEENPFRGLGALGDPPKRRWWSRIRPGLLVGGLIGLTACGVGVAWLANWIRH